MLVGRAGSSSVARPTSEQSDQPVDIGHGVGRPGLPGNRAVGYTWHFFKDDVRNNSETSPFCM